MIEKEIKNNIDKCSRCALCLQNCPVYNITKDDNNTARGLICKLTAYYKKILNKKEIRKDLKVCLYCTKCEQNCPSKVETTKVFAYKNAELYPSKFSQRLFLAAKLLPIKILYFINFFKKHAKFTPNSEIVYFKGCVAKSQHKITFLDKLFKNLNVSCCGLPYLAGGDLKNYEKVKRKNIQLLKRANLVLFDCASCKSTVESYYFQKEKLVFFSEFFKKKKYKIKENSRYKNKTITFHKPCHMSQSDFLAIEQFLQSIKGINYVPCDSNSCCGFGGSYFLFHPVISAKIAQKKAELIKKTNCDLILSACPSCVLGLRFSQLFYKGFKKTLELRDFIDKELTL